MRIHLNENDLNRIVKRSIRKVLKEESHQEYVKKLTANFDEAWEFVCQFARVKLNGKYNFINYYSGKLLSPNQWFDYARDFSCASAVIKLNGKYNYIDVDGKLRSPNQWFDAAYDYEHPKDYEYPVGIVDIGDTSYDIDIDGNLYDREVEKEHIEREYLDDLENRYPDDLDIYDPNY